jgi:hypothetical protein
MVPNIDGLVFVLSYGAKYWWVSICLYFCHEHGFACISSKKADNHTSEQLGVYIYDDEDSQPYVHTVT